MRKKLGIYSIYAIISAGVAYYMIIRYGHDVQDIMQRIHTYMRYIVYATASVVIGATIRQENTIQSKSIIGLLSLIHLISWTKIIVYDQYGAQIYMFIVTVLCIGCLYGILWIQKTRIRSILMLPILAMTIISAMIATSPFYRDISGRSDFYNTQKIKLHIYINEPMLIIQQAQANIGIKNNNISGSIIQNTPIVQPMQTNIDIPNNTEIQFTSTIPFGNSALFIQSPQGDIYEIYSQSIGTVTIGSGGLVVEVTGIAYTGIINQSLENYKNTLREQFDKQKEQYVENIIKNKLRNNIYVQYIGGKIFTYLGNKIAYMHTYQSNFEKRQTMRSETHMTNSISMSGENIAIPSIPLIRSRREKFTNLR